MGTDSGNREAGAVGVPRLVSWLLAVLARLASLCVRLINIPFIVVGAGCESIVATLDHLAHDLRAWCPWPWVTEFRRKWEEASHEERERMLKAMKRHAS